MRSMARRDNNPDSLDKRGRRKGQRGARKGTTTHEGKNGGSIGQEPYEPTERDREYVAKHVWYIGHEQCAQRLGISKKTLQRHFRKEIDEAKVDLELDLGMTAVEKARMGDGPMLRFLLATRFGKRWSPKYVHEHSGKDGGPIRMINMAPLIEGKTEEELAELERILESLEAEAVEEFGPATQPQP